MYFDKEAECWVDPGDPESLKAMEEAKKQKEPERAQVAQALEKFGAMTDQDLKLELRGRGLPTEGGREDFMERLRHASLAYQQLDRGCEAGGEEGGGRGQGDGGAAGGTEEALGSGGCG